MSSSDEDQSPAVRPHRRWLGVGRGWLIAILVVLVAAVVSARAVDNTFAVGGFTAHNAYKTSAVNSGSLTPPTGLVARAAGKSVALTWTVGATSHKTKQVVGYLDTRTTTICSSADTFTDLTTGLSAAAASYTDTTRSTKTATTLPGDWYCYEVATGYSTSWTKAAYAHVQGGFVAIGVSVSTTLTKTHTLPKINDATITVTFNQKIGTTLTQLKKKTAGTTAVCGIAKSGSYELMLGDESTSNSTTCKPSNKVSLGILKSSVKLTNTRYYTKLTWTITNTTTNHTYSIQLTFKTTTTLTTVTKYTGTPTWTFVPGTATASVIKSSSGTVTACRTNAHKPSLCEPTVTSRTI